MSVYLTPAELYTAKLGGLYDGDLPLPTTTYTKLLDCIIQNDLANAKYSNTLTRFIYSLYVSDLDDPYPRSDLSKLFYWKIHGIVPTHNGIQAEVTISGKQDSVPITDDLVKLWYQILFEDIDYAFLRDVDGYFIVDSTGAYLKVLEV